MAKHLLALLLRYIVRGYDKVGLAFDLAAPLGPL